MACMTVLGGPCRNRRTHILVKLAGLLVHRNHWISRIRRTMVHFEHFLHARDKFLVGFGRNDPIL
jgi:hypothetical protein